MLAQLPNNLYLCKCKDSSGVATLRKGQTDSLSLLSFVGIIHNVGSMKEQEIWKPVVGFEGLYEVSSNGRVRSVDRVIINKRNFPVRKRGRILRPGKKNGYLHVALAKNGYASHHYVHRIVALAFIPNPKGCLEIDHANTLRDDNRIENLRWVTHSENMNNVLSVAKSKSSYVDSGTLEKNWDNNKIKVFQFSLEGEFIAEWNSIIEAEAHLGTHGISNVISGKSLSCGGYLWSKNPEPMAQYPYPSQKKVAQITKDGVVLKVWDSISQAAKSLGCSVAAISRALRFEHGSSLGYIWRYADEDINNEKE